ncbi:unnamed protein product [Pylaiella littoralis]
MLHSSRRSSIATAFRLLIGLPYSRSLSLAVPHMASGPAATGGRTVVVTGADGGIGSEFCRHYASTGDQVFACRRKTKPDAASLFDNNSNIHVVDGVDITNDAGAACLVNALEKAGNPKVDVLINNAGVMTRARNALDIDVLRESMEINAFGALRITTALLNRKLLAAPGAKVILITSKMGSMADNTSGGAYGYRMSKAALNAAGVSLSHDLKGDGMAVGILHPGWVQTRMTGNSGLVDAHESVAGMTARIEELDLSNSGTFWGFKGDIIPW